MIITVLGANGQTGAEVVRQAIAAGHSVHAAESTGVQRFVLMSAYVVLRDRLRPGLKLASHLGMKMAIEDKTASETLLRSSELNWTIAYVSTLTDRPATGRAREVPPTERLGLRHRISRADSAAWMVKSVSLEQYFRAGVVLAQ